MKLQDLISIIKDVCLSQPSVNEVLEGSVYQLNERKNTQYGVAVITQGQHKQQGDFFYYNFILYYVDRLTASADNKVNVQSTAIDTLTNILNNLEEWDVEYDGSQFQTFTQKFEAECAGAYVTVSFILPISDCGTYNILDDYATKAWTLQAIGGASGITTGQVQTMITTAINAETARTEETYLKEHQSLANYYTSGQTDSAISAATEDMVTSSTVDTIWVGTSAEYSALTPVNTTIYFIKG